MVAKRRISENPGKVAKPVKLVNPEKPERVPNPNSKILSNKFVQDYLSMRLGENSVRIIKAANTEMTDEALATKCKLKVSEIRSLLNKLHNLRLADYTRTKDKDTGWYSYIWKVNLDGIYAVLEGAMHDEMKSLETKLDESTTIFSFYCPKCSKENKIDFNTATQIEFKCPNCRRQLKADKGQTQTITDKLEDLREKFFDFKSSVAEIKKN